LSRWDTSGDQSLLEFAPFVSFVMSIELFFIIAMRKGIISSRRNSNMVDILYLYYLPFCDVFVSSDKLHRRCAHLFLREDQEFVWGHDLKDDLRKIDEHYKSLPDNIRDKGIDFFALDPPNDDNFLVTRLWKKHLNWNGPRPVHRHDAEAESNMIKETNDFASASTLSDSDIDFDISNPDAILIKRQVSKKKGSWYQLPKDIQQ
jgi:hypothetical protein